MQESNELEKFGAGSSSKHALVVGATGATGKDLVNLLLNDPDFHRVDIFVRRRVDIQSSKLVVHVINFDEPQQWKDLVKGDVLFSCLGTTLKAAGSKDAQWKIDHDYQLEFAEAARENGVNSYVLVSSAGASAKSPIFYSSMKGKLEEAVHALGFPKLVIFNPPILDRKETDRTMEVAGIKAIRFLNKLGILRSQKPLPTRVLAQAMINSIKQGGSKAAHVKGEEIWSLAG